MPGTITATLDPALLNELVATQTAVAAAQAEAVTLRGLLRTATAACADWRQKVLDTRELLNLVEELADSPSVATATAVINAFRMWRSCVEGGVPVTWALAAPEPEPGGGAGVRGGFDEWEVPMGSAGDGECAF